jgi:multidrug transporter EmrE-like cation transporter
MRDPLLYLAGTAAAAGGLTWLKALIDGLPGLDPRQWGWSDRLAVAGAGAIYFTGLAIGMLLFARNALSTAYPLFLGFGFLAMLGGAVVFLGETVTWRHIGGAALVLAGAAAIARSRA